MNPSGIYKIINLVNKKFYIGSSVDLIRREKDHFRNLNNNVHQNIKLQNSFNKHGKLNFTFEVLEFVEKKECLTKREQFYFDLLNPHYNICKLAGNTLGFKHSDEVKKQVGIRSKGNKYRLGVKMSDEEKIKIGLINKGNKYNLGRIQGDFVKNKVSQANRGEKNKHSKLNKYTVKKIRKLYNPEINSFGKIGKIYNVDRKTIENVVKKITWKHI